MAVITGSDLLNDFLSGQDDDDQIFGLALDDFLNGGGGNDLLDGGADNDSLSGDNSFSLKGADTLIGGSGDDAFEFSVFDGDSTALNLDLVTDFEGAGVADGDVLNLRGSPFGFPTPLLSFGGASTAPVVGTPLGVPFDGLVTVYYALVGSDTLVFGDTNDDGAYDETDFTVQLSGAHLLVASDFGDTDFVISGTDDGETINGTEGDDNILAAGGNDTINALGGADRVDGGSGDDIINGGDGDDDGDFSGDIALIGGEGNDTINGGAGNDSANGGAGNDIMDGGDGDEFFFGGDDDDTMAGGLGDDFLIGDGGNDSLTGGDGADALDGGSGDDTLVGGLGDDTLSGDNTFSGVLGADVLTGGGGADSFAWHVGSDNSTATVRDRVTDFQGAGVVGGDLLLLRLPSFPALILSFGGARAAPAFGNDLGAAGDGIAALYYSVTGGNTLVFTDSDDDGVYDADDFTVRLNGTHTLVQSDFRLISDEGDTPFAIVGTNGADTINGTDGDDTIFGLGGNDIINARGGSDEVYGGAGADIINAGAGDDFDFNGFGPALFGEAGNDVINGDGGNDWASGGNGDDILNGGAGRDFLNGDAGNDVLNGGAGDDEVMAGGAGSDIINAGDGDDNADAGTGNDVVRGGAGEDNLRGEEGNDEIYGDGDDDRLEGNEGDDFMSGGAGNDELAGYEGADRNEGGGGRDLFEFSLRNNHSTRNQFDTIVDFQGAGAAVGDLIGLDRETFAFRGQININPVVGAALPGAGNGVMDLVYVHKSGSTWLIADEDDDGRLDGGDFSVRLDGLHHLTTDDFDDATFVTIGTDGPDEIIGTEDTDIVFAGGGDDEVFGNGGDDELHGGAGDDLLDSGLGFDDLYGEDGNDTLIIREFGGFFAAGASGGAGDDTLFGSDVEFSFVRLNGDDGNDVLNAGTGGAVMYGGLGADQIVGGIGNDAMNGGPDGFTLDGEQDLFVFGTSWGEDNISDFEDIVDRIDMRGSGLQYGDLTIVDAFGGGGFATRITVTGDPSVGEIFVATDPALITAADFLFAAPLSPFAAPVGGVVGKMMDDLFLM